MMEEKYTTTVDVTTEGWCSIKSLSGGIGDVNIMVVLKILWMQNIERFMCATSREIYACYKYRIIKYGRQNYVFS